MWHLLSALNAQPNPMWAKASGLSPCSTCKHFISSRVLCMLNWILEYSLKLLFYHCVALSFNIIVYCASKSCRPESHCAIPVSLSPKFTVCCKFSECCNWACCKFTGNQEFLTTAVAKLPSWREAQCNSSSNSGLKQNKANRSLLTCCSSG